MNDAGLPTRSDQTTNPSVVVNGRIYRWPLRPTVVICYDGCDPNYIEAALQASAVPTLARMIAEGFASTALAAMPTFTNPNNISIVCGAPPAVHGVAGNYYLDRQTEREVMMLDASLMRAPTILAKCSEAGAKVVAITAKDKLRKALGHRLKGIAFSAERAAEATLEENGITDVLTLVGRTTPEQYSPDLSLFVLDAGVRLLEAHRPDLLYLSLSDYVQHKYAPGTAEANAFMAAVDRRFLDLLALGATLGVVADHGMSDMTGPDGLPNVIFLGDHLDAAFGAGTTRVICPITDPFIRHHGALGGFVRVHVMRPDLDHAAILELISKVPGVGLAVTGDEASARFALPPDREADIVVIGASGVAIGARAADHDLSQLAGAQLRSHGGLSEQTVPFILSHRLNADYATRAENLRNFDIFDFAINGVI